ncbi:MAG: hypothetical protein LC123_08705 [Burkholderiales bacterium]|nr:hypothetical protein [Rhodocyclaceae bacterium]MCZ2173760.1 hypothetical protein [Burkholderiales bacterium]HNQ56091.1 hypothetical protein [Candidatus Desulfobacillus denitrificans]MCQ3923845.1 hypothetical protein [Rhodocyclaceae bacterium]MCZ2419905.1 hypothetical protein [Burkholderiales bacterium]
MIFQPAIIALLLASGIAVAMLAAAAPFALQVIRQWDIASGTERQLLLERRTYLFSTLAAFVMVVQLVALLLFVFNADRMAEMFVGAMCAVGTLNVNPFGFPALLAQMAVFFLAAAWLAVNHVDTRAPDYPLVRVKYALLLILLPALALAFVLQLKYFLGLRADVITSCCGSLFSGDAKGLAAEVAALKPLPAMTLFYVVLAVAAGLTFFHARTRRAGYAAAAASAAAFVATIVGVLSFVSLYLYEHPNHHCPFCILKPEYGHQGYWLYVPLFAATAAGLGTGALQPFRQVASLREIVPAVSARLADLAAFGYLLVALIATYFVLHSNLILIEH